jgi:hypothetical protein
MLIVRKFSFLSSSKVRRWIMESVKLLPDQLERCYLVAAATQKVIFAQRARYSAGPRKRAA